MIILDEERAGPIGRLLRVNRSQTAAIADRNSNRDRQKLDVLDGLRGIAVLEVIVFHLFSGMARPDVSTSLLPVLRWFRFGYTGVHLFLVLSGFCLTHSLIRRTNAGRPQPFSSYLTSRWRRIAPPYYLAMALYLAFPMIALVLRRPSSQAEFLSVRQILLHLTFLHGYFADTIDAISIPFWSLSLEFQFYLTLPIIYGLAIRFGALPVVLFVALSSLIFRLILIQNIQGYDHLLNGSFLGRWAEFGFGMGGAFWYNAQKRRLDSSHAWLAICIGLLAFGFVLDDMKIQSVSDLVIGAGYASLLLAVLLASERSGWLGRGVEFAPLVWVGMISYSLYLTHTLILERGLQLSWKVIGPRGFAMEFAVVMALLAMVLGFGTLYFRVVERRFLRSVDSTSTKRS